MAGKLPGISRDLSPPCRGELPGTLPANVLGKQPGSVPAACRACHLHFERRCAMTLGALIDCCHRLSVDRKTLHGWLAKAQLSMQAHPQDGRSKGLTEDHLLLLARTHHRRLESLPVEPAAPTALVTVPALPELSAELLSLLHTLRALPEQIAALEQHLDQLTALVQSLLRPTVTVAPRQQPTRPGKQRPAPTTQARRALASPTPRPGPSAPGH